MVIGLHFYINTIIVFVTFIPTIIFIIFIINVACAIITRVLGGLLHFLFQQ